MTMLIIATLAVLVVVGIVVGNLLYMTWLLRHEEDVDPSSTGAVSVTLTADSSRFTEEMRRLSAVTQRMSEQLGDALMPAIRIAADAMGKFAGQIDVWRAGVDAKWSTRGALYARLGWPDTCVDEEVQRALHEELLFPTVAAVAFMRGWVENRPAPTDEYLEHARALTLTPHPIYDGLVTS